MTPVMMKMMTQMEMSLQNHLHIMVCMVAAGVLHLTVSLFL